MFEVEKSLGLNFKSQLKKFQQKRFAFDFVVVVVPMKVNFVKI